MIGRRRIAGVGREEADGVVAPVVDQAALEQLAVVDEGVHGQQFDGGDAERLDIFHDCLVSETGIGALLMRRHRRMPLGEPLHMRLVHHGFVPTYLARTPLPMPVEVRIDHHAFRHERCAVAIVEGKVPVVVTDGVAEQLVRPLQLAGMRPCIRIEQEFVGVESQALIGFVGAVHPQTIDGARMHVGNVAVPDLVGIFRQRDTLQLRAAGRIEQTHLHLRGVGGKQREVGAFGVPNRTVGLLTAFANTRFFDIDHVTPSNYRNSAHVSA